MNGLPEELKTLSPDVHWDERKDTFYVRARGLAPSDTSGYIHRFRQVLDETPNNVGVRFLLAKYLAASGQHQEAQAELQQVAQSGDVVWSVKAEQLLDPKP